MKKAIYKFYADCGRMGDLEGVLISTKEKVKMLIDSEIEVYFGEVLGKHSEVEGTIEKGEMTFISDSAEVVGIMEKYNLTSGHNPFEYQSYSFEIEGVDTDDLTVGEIVDILIKKK